MRRGLIKTAEPACRTSPAHNGCDFRWRNVGGQRRSHFWQDSQDFEDVLGRRQVLTAEDTFAQRIPGGPILQNPVHPVSKRFHAKVHFADFPPALPPTAIAPCAPGRNMMPLHNINNDASYRHENDLGH